MLKIQTLLEKSPKTLAYLTYKYLRTKNVIKNVGPAFGSVQRIGAFQCSESFKRLFLAHCGCQTGALTVLWDCHTSCDWEHYHASVCLLFLCSGRSSDAQLSQGGFALEAGRVLHSFHPPMLHMLRNEMYSLEQSRTTHSQYTNGEIKIQNNKVMSFSLICMVKSNNTFTS